MKRHQDVLILELAANMPAPSILNACAIVDEHGLILVDTGMPGMLGAIEAELAQAGYNLGDIRHILITHHDADHIGSLAAVVEATGAQVMALETEVPYITGELPPQKRPTPGQIAAMLADPNTPTQMRTYLQMQLPTGRVDRVLHDGELLPFAGGVRVVATPGHTRGHTSYYLQRSKTLISGDALTAPEGHLAGPMPRATPDILTALASVRKLAALEVDAIVTYHGGLVENAAEALAALAKSSETV